MFGIGVGELLVILLIVMVLFGAGKLPNVMSDLGKGMKAFRDGMNGAAHSEDDIEDRHEKKSAKVAKAASVSEEAKKTVAGKAKTNSKKAS